MIAIHEARERPGDTVAYRPAGEPGWQPEYGTVRAVNEAGYVFVYFGGPNAKACRPEDLEWIR